jgi:hypothetical protein
MKITNNQSLFKLSFRSLAIALVALTAFNCTSEEELAAPPAEAAVEVAETASSQSTDAASLTVSGAFIEYSDANLCAECTFVLPENASVVDGTALGIKPGDVVCLNSAFKYKAIELVNAEGSAEKPIIIATCGE